MKGGQSEDNKSYHISHILVKKKNNLKLTTNLTLTSLQIYKKQRNKNKHPVVLVLLILHNRH